MITPRTNILEISPQKLVINMVAQAATTKFLLVEKKSTGNIHKSLSCLQGGHNAQQQLAGKQWNMTS